MFKGTYYSAGRFLARYKIEKKIIEIQNDNCDKAILAHSLTSSLGKRSENPEDITTGILQVNSCTMNNKKSKDEIQATIHSIISVDVPIDCPVYANCDEVRNMIEVYFSIIVTTILLLTFKPYLRTSGVSQAIFLRALGVLSGSLAKFRKMKGKGAGASNCIYQKRQKRIFEGLILIFHK